MKKMLLGLLFLVGCTQNNPNATLTEERSQSLQSVSGIVISPDAGVLDSTGADVTATFTVNSTSNEGRDANISLEKGTEGFSLLTATCSNFSKLRACTVRVKFTVGSKANGLYKDKMIMNDAEILLSSNLNKPTPVNDTSGLKVSEGASEDVSSLSFGTLAATGSVTKSLVIKDSLKSTKNAIVISSASSEFSVLTNSCTATLVNSSAGCSVRIQFIGTGKTVGLHESNLLVADKAIPMSATIQGSTVVSGVSDLRILVEDVESSSKNFGSIATGNKSSVVVKMKNQGTGAATGLALALSGSSAFSVTSSTCVSVVQAGSTCQLTVNLNAINLVGTQSGSLSYGGKSLSLAALITGSCSVDKHAEGGVCVSNIQSESITNGTRSKTYSVANASWGNWSYRCSVGYAPSGEACLPAKAPAPQVTIALNNDETKLIVTSTCKTNLSGIFLDLFYQIDNPAPSYSYPFNLNGNYLHEDLSFRQAPCVIVDPINNNGLTTVMVDIVPEMRNRLAYAHAMQFGPQRWDSQTSDFGNMPEVFVPELVNPMPQGITLVNLNREPNPICKYGEYNLKDNYPDEESCQAPHTFHWEAPQVAMTQCSDRFDNPYSCQNSRKRECSWEVETVEPRNCEEIASDENTCGFYSNCQWTYLDEEDPDQGGTCVGTTDYEYGFCGGEYATSGGGGHGPGHGSQGSCKDENDNEVGLQQQDCSGEEVSLEWDNSSDLQSNPLLSSIYKVGNDYVVKVSSSDLFSDGEGSIKFNLVENSPLALIKDTEGNSATKTSYINSTAMFNGKSYVNLDGSIHSIGYIENGVGHYVDEISGTFGAVANVSSKLVYLTDQKIKSSIDGQNFIDLNFDIGANGSIQISTIRIAKDYVFFQTKKSAPNSRGLFTLWRTDGTSQGTIQLDSDIARGDGRGLDLFLINYNQNLIGYYGNWGSYYENSATDNPATKVLNSAYSIKVTTGSVQSNQTVFQVPSAEGANPGGLNIWEPQIVGDSNYLYLIARIGQGDRHKILKINSSGVVTNLMANMDSSYSVQNMPGVVNGKVYAMINDENDETNLYVEQNGTMVLEKNLAGLRGDSRVTIGYEKMYGHNLYFINTNTDADADGDYARLYEYNTVTQALRKVPTDGEVTGYVILDNIMFLNIISPIYGNELYFWGL